MRILAHSTKARIRKELTNNAEHIQNNRVRYSYNSRKKFSDGIFNELHRLLKFPDKGTFSFLHHMVVKEKTNKLRERLSYIIHEKNKREILNRLKHIYLLKRESVRKITKLFSYPSHDDSSFCKKQHDWKTLVK